MQYGSFLMNVETKGVIS